MGYRPLIQRIEPKTRKQKLKDRLITIGLAVLLIAALEVDALSFVFGLRSIVIDVAHQILEKP